MPTSPQRGEIITVFGGSGFVGRHVVRALVRRGYRVRVAVRRPDLAQHLQPVGGVGQIHAVQANLRYPWSIERALAGASGVVNCVGILHESGRQSFEAVQGTGPGSIATAARAAGMARMVHISALGAEANAASAYARSKAAGEAGVLSQCPDAVILRPSVVFGPEDDFFNRFAALARLSPVLPLIGGGETLFQPVFVGDLAEAVAAAIEGRARAGTIYEIGGPETRSFAELMQTMLDTIGRRRLLLPVPFWLARWQAALLQLLPKPLLTVDQVLMLESDNVVSAEAEADHRTLSGLGIRPHSMAAILPSYLYRYRPHGQFEPKRSS